MNYSITKDFMIKGYIAHEYNTAADEYHYLEENGVAASSQDIAEDVVYGLNRTAKIEGLPFTFTTDEVIDIIGEWTLEEEVA